MLSVDVVSFRRPLDDVWREITDALPGCATWHRRVLASVEAFDRAAEPLPPMHALWRVLLDTGVR